MTFSILVIEQHSDHEIELCRVGSNADAIVKALKSKTLSIVMGGGQEKAIVHSEIRVGQGG